MTTLESLFGGLTLIVALFFALRFARLPNYWCGVISGAVPTLAYFIYAALHWPGLDMVAMHFAVYISTAIVLALLGSRNRQSGQKIHWIPKLFIAFFIILFIVDANLLFISSRGLPPVVASWLLPHKDGQRVYTAFPGVVAHGEEAAKEVGQYQKAQHEQGQLGWQVTLTGLDRLHVHDPSILIVHASDKYQQPITGAQVNVSLLRPAQSQNDRKIHLEDKGAGVYQANISMDEPGLWIAVLRVEKDQDKYESQHTITVAGAR